MLRKRLPYSATVSSCMLGGHTRGLPSREAYEIRSDLPGVARALQKLHCSKKHVHGPPDAKATLWTNRSLVAKITKAMNQPKSRSVYAVEEDEENFEDAEGQDQEEPTVRNFAGQPRQPKPRGRPKHDDKKTEEPDQELTAGEKHRLFRAIEHVHSQLGHPSNQTLARALRLSGASDHAIQAALEYRCPTCERLKEPPPTLPHKILSVKGFNEMVAVDCFMLADSDGVQKLFLNAVDVASGFQIVAVLKAGGLPEVCADVARTFRYTTEGALRWRWRVPQRVCERAGAHGSSDGYYGGD